MAMSRSFGSRSLTTRPPMDNSPDVIVSSPAIIRSAVDLPQPEGPTRTKNSPSATSSDSLWTAWNPFSYTLSTSLSTMSPTREPSPVLVLTPRTCCSLADPADLADRVDEVFPGPATPVRLSPESSTRFHTISNAEGNSRPMGPPARAGGRAARHWLTQGEYEHEIQKAGRVDRDGVVTDPRRRGMWQR